MTDKKRRQRGSRTHGGGTHKNRRGAGNRGGRGAAGRDKHEFHNYEPLGKSGFKRPEYAQTDVAEVRVQKLDEDAALYAADGLAEVDDDGVYRFDARDVVDDGHEVDVVKVLGGGQVRQRLHVVADAFTAGARERIEAAGGTAELTERGERAAEGDESEADADGDGDADGDADDDQKSKEATGDEN
jgi:large subunit ribosomal protein L15